MINNPTLVEQDPKKELQRQLAYLESDEQPVRELKLKNSVKYAARVAEVKARLAGLKGADLALLQEKVLEEAREDLEKSKAKEEKNAEAEEAKAKENALPEAIKRSQELAEAEVKERLRIESIKGDVKPDKSAEEPKAEEPTPEPEVKEEKNKKSKK